MDFCCKQKDFCNRCTRFFGVKCPSLARMAKHSIRRGIVNLSCHEKISEIAVTVAEKTLAVSNLGLNGTLQRRRDTNIENRTEIA